MNVQSYFKRLSIERNKELTLGYLANLQKQHLQKIPFENLDVTRKVNITLDVSRFYEKVIGAHRGGFCYELNGLFQWFLTELGFRSHLIACTVKKPNGWAKANTHAAMIVQLEQPYLVDVGFGDSARQPIPLTGEVLTDVSGAYRVIRNEQGLYDLQRLDKEGWKILYRFSVAPVPLVGFSEGCQYNQTSPDSTFTHGDIVTIATETGRITLSDYTVTKTDNGKKDKWELTEEEKNKFLEDYFQIKL